MYLKMFLGMGFVWIMEIISGALGSSVHEAWWYENNYYTVICLVFVIKKVPVPNL